MTSTKNKKTFKRTENKDYINKIIAERLLLKPLFIQVPSISKKIAKIIKVTDRGLAVHFANFIPPSGPIILTGVISNYYSEIEVNVIKPVQESIFLCTANFLRISPQSRREVRYPVGGINVKRIKISQNALEIRGDTLPPECKAVMDKYTAEKSGIADYLLISPLDRKSKIHQEVARTGKTFFIADTRSMKSFDPFEDGNEDLVNLREFFGDALQAERTKMLNKNIIGRIVSPIFGPQSSDEWVPIGFIDIISKNRIEFIKLMEVKALSFEIVEKIIDAAQIEIQEDQRVIDVSKSGLRIHVKNRELIKAMTHRPDFTFTLQVPGQAAINAVGIIKTKQPLDDGSMIIGVKIHGEKTRQEHFLRYYEFIKALQEKGKTQA